mgnify:CR=1 FL=1
MDALTLVEPNGPLGPFELLKQHKARTGPVLHLADGRCIRLLSDTSFQLTDSSGKHLQYGSVENIEYQPNLINEHRKQNPRTIVSFK